MWGQPQQGRVYSHSRTAINPMDTRFQTDSSKVIWIMREVIVSEETSNTYGLSPNPPSLPPASHTPPVWPNKTISTPSQPSGAFSPPLAPKDGAAVEQQEKQEVTR